uniref:Uncharacterized protein n=1 Tax=Anguilla anguilla TaxID=7936 RepID=A0A0E9QME7_ANGAN
MHAGYFYIEAPLVHILNDDCKEKHDCRYECIMKYRCGKTKKKNACHF